jgi:hypothetical protein
MLIIIRIAYEFYFMIYLARYKCMLYLLFFLLLLFGTVDVSIAQESKSDLNQQQSEYFHVKWLTNWPSESKNHHKKQLLYGIRFPLLPIIPTIFGF